MTTRAIALGATAFPLAALALASACRQVLGVEQRNDGPPLLSLGEACDTCVAETCDDVERACAGEPACVELVQCMTAAGLDRPIARVACAAEHPAGLTAPSFEAMDQCLRAPCQDACFGREGFFAGYSSECQDCMSVSCLDQMGACVADADCERSAVGAIGDADEIDPAGMDPLTGALRERVAEYELALCLGAANAVDTGSCRPECGFEGDNFSCLHDWGFPTPSSETARVEWAVIDGLDISSSLLIPGVHVEYCGADFGVPIPCKTIASGTTGALGYASVTLPLSPQIGFRGYLRLTEGDAGPAIYPSHTFIGGPIARDFRGGTPVYLRSTVDQLASSFTGASLLSGRSVLVLAFIDCANRFAPGIRALLPAEAMEGAVAIYNPSDTSTSITGVVSIWNVMPGCYDVGGWRDSDGDGDHDDDETTHRMRINVAPNMGTWAYLGPINATPDDVVHACQPDFEL